MTQAEAEFIVSKLLAAYPTFRGNDELTAAVYVEQLVKLPDPKMGLQAANDLIGVEYYLPTVAKVREQYDRIREARAARTLALNEPKATPEELAEGRRIGLEFLARLDARNDVFKQETEADIEARRARAATL